MNKKRMFTLSIIVYTIIYLTACKAEDDFQKKTRVVLTTGFKKNEIFRIENMSCMMPEMLIYLINTKNEYENAYGEKIWDVSYSGESLEENIKDTVLERIARIKALNLLANENGVILTDEEENKIVKAADIYYGAMTDDEKKILGADKEIILKMYKEYALAEKVYDVIVSDINPEISDDEARTITIQQILIKTYSLDEHGREVRYSNEEKNKAYEKALEAYKRACNNENFEKLTSEYSEDDKIEYSFGKDTVDAVFGDVAFGLGTNEISDIIETKFGYHIIKCISTFDKNETDKNKIKIVEQKRKAEFNNVYSEFTNDLIKNIDQKKWQKLSLMDYKELKLINFFDIYHSVFEQADIKDSN